MVSLIKGKAQAQQEAQPRQAPQRLREQMQAKAQLLGLLPKEPEQELLLAARSLLAQPAAQSFLRYLAHSQGL